MKKTAILLAVLVLISAMLCACGGKGGSNALIGTWEGETGGTTMEISFRDGGKGSISALAGLVGFDFTYTVSGDKLMMTFSEEDKSLGLDLSECTFSVSGSTLKLINVDGESIDFTKK